MFDLIVGTGERPLRERSVRSKVVAAVIHGVVIVVVIGIPLLLSTDQLPAVEPTMLAFVAAPPAPPPPPPPPLAAAVKPARPVAEPARTTGAFAAPIAAPSIVEPERLTARDQDTTGGVLGGVEGGVAGGVLGGIVGGLVAPVAPPPPPPPPPAPPQPPAIARGPVRIGGQITAPALQHRVEPVYPETAAIAHVGGMVILEAVVRADGCVESAKVLRSRHPLLDRAAKEALMQWQYSPLILNGVATPFVLTVTFNFGFQK
ncbi:MAG: energy transducer TonB [Acidobacteriota bacterium]